MNRRCLSNRSPCLIAPNSDPCFAGKNDPSDRAETGGAEPQIAEQSRSWRAEIGEAIAHRARRDGKFAVKNYMPKFLLPAKATPASALALPQSVYWSRQRSIRRFCIIFLSRILKLDLQSILGATASEGGARTVKNILHLLRAVTLRGSIRSKCSIGRPQDSAPDGHHTEHCLMENQSSSRA
jgi:hypothetical protein